FSSDSSVPLFHAQVIACVSYSVTDPWAIVLFMSTYNTFSAIIFLFLVVISYVP
ncbi:hypothetical protein L9F63_004045, partial [Diploptera punctata]